MPVGGAHSRARGSPWRGKMALMARSGPLAPSESVTSYAAVATRKWWTRSWARILRAPWSADFYAAYNH